MVHNYKSKGSDFYANSKAWLFYKQCMYLEMNLTFLYNLVC